MPPISTPRIGFLLFASWLVAIAASWGTLENITLMVLISYGFVRTADAAVVHGNARRRPFHQIGFRRRFRARRKLQL